MVFGLVVFPMPLSRQGKTQEFFDKFKAGLRTLNHPVCHSPTLIGKIERGDTASLRSRTCVKRNAVFGARFKGLSLYVLYQKGNLIQKRLGVHKIFVRKFGFTTPPPPEKGPK